MKFRLTKITVELESEFLLSINEGNTRCTLGQLRTFIYNKRQRRYDPWNNEQLRQEFLSLQNHGEAGHMVTSGMGGGGHEPVHFPLPTSPEPGSPSLSSSSGSPRRAPIALPREGPAHRVQRHAERLSSRATHVLADWTLQHLHQPYVNSLEQEQLASEAGLRPAQVRQWLNNFRKRIWKVNGKHTEHSVSINYLTELKQRAGTSDGEGHPTEAGPRVPAAK
jgi:hypothetical protein